MRRDADATDDQRELASFILASGARVICCLSASSIADEIKLLQQALVLAEKGTPGRGKRRLNSHTKVRPTNGSDNVGAVELFSSSSGQHSLSAAIATC